MIAELPLKRGEPILASRIMAQGAIPGLVVLGGGCPLARQPAPLGRGGGGIRTHGTLAPLPDLGVLRSVNPAR